MRQLDHTARRRIVKQLPPKRCQARSSRTGEQCRQWALVGGSVCQAHGGRAPQVRAAAEQAVSVAQALAEGRPRAAWEILGDVQHTSDVLFREARAKLVQGELSVADFDRLVQAMERTHRLTTSNVHAGLAERRARFEQGQANQMMAVFSRILARLELSREQRALVPAAVKAEVAPLLALDGEVVDDAH